MQYHAIVSFLIGSIFLLPMETHAQARSGTLMNPKISLDGLFAAGGSSVNDDQIQILQGGAHDPQKNGFTVQNVELSMTAAVDPYLNGEAHIIYQLDATGESRLELEEIFFTTQSLPAGLQLKGGHYFTEFGRLNNRHPHSWSFVDQPVISSRLLGGDGLRNPGLRLSWLAPLPLYSELFFGIQNANGETASSFLGAADATDFEGHPILKNKVSEIGDLLYFTRWLNSVDLTSTTTINLGASALFGPNATGENTRTNIYGVDLYLKWQPLSTVRGWPFVKWQFEWMKRNYEAGASTSVYKETLKDWGLYNQIVWGFIPGWAWGLRYEHADGNGSGNSTNRDRRDRYSTNLTWFPSEFSKLRLQYNLDDAQHLDKKAHAVWLQFEFMFGAHAAHKF